MSARAVPLPADARALTLAAEAAYGPCTCSPALGRICAGHAFLLDDPTRRMGVKVWQRLLFMRSQRERILREDGVPTQPSKRVEPRADPTALVIWA